MWKPKFHTQNKGQRKLTKTNISLARLRSNAKRKGRTNLGQSPSLLLHLVRFGNIITLIGLGFVFCLLLRSWLGSASTLVSHTKLMVQILDNFIIHLGGRWRLHKANSFYESNASPYTFLPASEFLHFFWLQSSLEGFFFCLLFKCKTEVGEGDACNSTSRANYLRGRETHG